MSSPRSAPKAKITFRHNFLPVIIGLMAFAGILGFLNLGWLEAQAQYRFSPRVSAATLVAEAPNNKAPSDASQIIIPSIDAQAPLNTSIPDLTEWKIQIALRSGVVHLGNTAMPGQIGNVVIVGHSSGPPWSPGKFNFVFTLLGKMKKGDKIFVDYQGTRYAYKMYGSEVITPDNLSVLRQGKDAELSLITCTPVGTSKNRLVIHAVQISPNPAHNKPNPNAGIINLKKLPS